MDNLHQKLQEASEKIAELARQVNQWEIILVHCPDEVREDVEFMIIVAREKLESKRGLKSSIKKCIEGTRENIQMGEDALKNYALKVKRLQKM